MSEANSKLKDSTVVLKFGGTSVADPDCIRRVCAIAMEEAKQHNVIVVLSAMGKSTDALVKLANDITDKPTARELDMLLSTGELVSISLATMCIHHQGAGAVALTGGQAGFITEALHNKARIAEIKTDRIRKHLEKGEIVFVAGFQGVSEDGELTTLGRGGSDTSAVALAAAMEACRCDIYTDVNGVYTTDPRIVPEARKLDYISYEEMVEMASLGAGVLHLRSVELAKKYNIDLRVLSSFAVGTKLRETGKLDKDEGTRVISLKRIEEMELTKAVSGVALDDKQARLAVLGVPDVPGIAAKVFTTLAKNNVSVDMIIQSVAQDGTNEIAFTVARGDAQEAKKILDSLRAELKATDVVIDDDIVKVSIVGAGMLNQPGIASNLFACLADNNINIEMISTSEIKISCLVASKDAQKAVQVIHKKFELEKSEEKVIA